MNEACDIVVDEFGCSHCRSCGVTWDPKDGEESPCEGEAAVGFFGLVGLAVAAIAVVSIAVLFLRLAAGVVVDAGARLAFLVFGWGG